MLTSFTAAVYTPVPWPCGSSFLPHVLRQFQHLLEQEHATPPAEKQIGSEKSIKSSINKENLKHKQTKSYTFDTNYSYKQTTCTPVSFALLQ